MDSKSLKIVTQSQSLQLFFLVFLFVFFCKYVWEKCFLTSRNLVSSSVLFIQHLSQALLLLGSAILPLARKAPDTTVAYLKSSTNQFNKS